MLRGAGGQRYCVLSAERPQSQVRPKLVIFQKGLGMLVRRLDCFNDGLFEKHSGDTKMLFSGLGSIVRAPA